MNRALAAAQSIPVPGDVEANLAHHERLAGVASEAGARLVVFPELSLTGYELERAADLAFTPDDARLRPLVEIAADRDVTIVAGAPVRLEDRLHIGAFVVGADGSRLLYTKRHPGVGEERFIEAGDRDPAPTVGGLPAAVAICADANHPSHPARAAERGARTYLLGSLIVPDEMPTKTALLRCYAARHRMVVVFSNYGAPSGGLPAAGGSAIWNETGDRLAALDGPGAGVVVALERDGRWQADAIPVSAS